MSSLPVVSVVETSAGVPSLQSISATQAPLPREPLPTDAQAFEGESILERVLDLEEIDKNIYRGVSPEVPRWGRIYGGQTCSQALVASCRTVSPEFIVHSLHAYFLRPGNDDLPIIYYVERLRDGKSFATRRVTALQDGTAIFMQMVSFTLAEEGLEHQDVMPEVPPPESVQSLMELYKEMLKDSRLTVPARKNLERSTTFPFPVDVRRVTPDSLKQRLERNPPVHRSWMRVRGQLSNSLMLHQCALAYMSDWSLLETTLLPHALHGLIQTDTEASLQMASIDHTIWFHHAFRADEWLLYDMDSPSASGGRGFARGRFFNRDGKLVVSTAQEGLIRRHRGPPPPIRPVGSKKKPTDERDENSRSAVKKQIKANL